MGESQTTIASRSTFRPDKFVTQNSLGAADRISFADLARFALGKGAEYAIAKATDNEERTVKRWFSGESRRPESALRFVLAEIMRRLD